MKTKLLIIMVICSQFVFSQKRSLRVANEQYLKSNYSSVIENYKTIRATKYAMQFSDLIKLAHSYYNIGDYENAKMYYDLAFKRRTTTDRSTWSRCVWEEFSLGQSEARTAGAAAPVAATG